MGTKFKGYAIARDTKTSNGFVMEFLYNYNGDYASATNLTFNSVDHAIQFAKMYPKLVSDGSWVQGPKGGYYNVLYKRFYKQNKGETK